MIANQASYLLCVRRPRVIFGSHKWRSVPEGLGQRAWLKGMRLQERQGCRVRIHADRWPVNLTAERVQSMSARFCAGNEVEKGNRRAWLDKR